MKNLYLLLMLGGAAPFCKAEPVHLKKAKQIAAAYMKRTAEVRNVAGVRTSAPTADEADVFEPLYIFNRGRGEGFVVVSGDDRLPQVLGFTDTGDFVEEQMPPALLDMLDSYRATVDALQKTGGAPVASPRAVEGRVDVAPLIRTHWHQSAPYNNLCPMLVKNGSGRSLTGCTATAASQIIYYWHKDCNDRSLRDTPTYSYGDAPVTESVPAGTPLKWDLMQPQYGNSYPAEMGEAVATLMLITGTTLWQTYGNSTSGELPKLPDMFGGQYGLNAKHAGKWNYSAAAWEKLIYDELAEGRPIEYAGSHPTNGGHAIVLDGYRAADNLFHFNFGWGGQGDGYYTLDDANGVNGFSQSQHMVYGISPRTLNLEAGIVTDKLLKGTTNTVRVRFTNNSTLPYTGIYLFCLTGTNKPAGIAKATRSDTKTVVPTGRTLNVDFEFKPSSPLDYTIYVVDKNNRVLAQKKMVSEATVPELALQAFGVNTNGETETVTIRENGADVQRPFSIVHYTDALVSARLRNGANGTFCEPGLRCFLSAYNEEQGAFEPVKTSIQTSTAFRPDEVRTVEFPFTRLSEEKLYKATFSDIITNNIGYTVDCSQAADTVVYFRVKAPSLTALSTQDGEMTVAGKWNADAFRKLAADASVCRYDLTAVEGLNSQPEAANRNALFYVADGASVTGTNIVRAGVCDDLQLETGHDFAPRADFTARRATYFHNRPSAQWNTLVLPFDCDVPDGIMARRVTKLLLSYIYECDSVNLTLKSGTPYLYIAGAPCHDRFTATDVNVSVNVPSQATDSLRGTFVNLPATEGMCVLADGENQSFLPAEGAVVPAFTAYLDYKRAVGASSFPYKQKDLLSLAIARLMTEACTLLEEQADNAGAEATADFRAAIDEAGRQLRLQPEYAELRKVQAALEEAMAAYANAQRPTDGGLRNLTALLQNPSFESGNLSGWDIEEGATSRPAVSRITTSLANYMSGADGACVLYAPMSGGGSAAVSQTVEGLENGLYRVEASVASDTGNRVELFANGSASQVEIDDFGPMYLHEAAVEEAEVTDGTLTLGVRCAGSWYKADNFRLYRVGQPTGIARTDAPSDGLRVRGGRGCIRLTADTECRAIVCDMSGRVVVVRMVKGELTLSGLPAGTYLVNRHKVLVF